MIRRINENFFITNAHLHALERTADKCAVIRHFFGLDVGNVIQLAGAVVQRYIRIGEYQQQFVCLLPAHTLRTADDTAHTQIWLTQELRQQQQLRRNQVDCVHRIALHQLQPMARTEAFRHYQSAACRQHAHINIEIAGKSQASLTKNYCLLINAEDTVLLREKVRPAMIAAPQQLAFAGAAAGHNAHAGRLWDSLAAELLIFAHLGSDNRHGFCVAVGQKAD